jgi:hypothetical protein
MLSGLKVGLCGGLFFPKQSEIVRLHDIERVWPEQLRRME